ncbi:DUF2867 domain-containing protein [Vibrio paucivorans]|uniref:SDR family oxidoreductase n=1 Tax=Vibrio paucivorans TaxID=2829489 RepID=A0A9X3HS23_9VIBR|nr:DUF2867 domain-containing protein [Vibrio paucivorans]MCW8334423.1 SDR family oxidoreductase [Vibrio paucivorans]
MKNVLVLGASGYVGSQLLPQFLDQGYNVTASARHIDYLKARTTPHPNLKFKYLDLADTNETSALLPQFDLVYFLVHGMAEGHDFIDYEISLAHNVKNALKGSPVQHVIYLSAIQPNNGSSPHLQARKQTGDVLRSSGVPITEIRAGVIVGPGSAAFEIMRDFVYNLPILIAPKWVDSRANPIALKNLNHYLIQLAKHSPTDSNIFEAGGPDTLTYREQFSIIAKAANKPLRLWSTPLMTPNIASYWLGVVTSVPSNIGRALLAGLTHDYVANASPLQSKFPQSLVSFEQMVQESLESEGTFIRSNVWGYDPTALERWQAGFGYYPKQAGASIKTSLPASVLWKVARKLGSREEGYFFANILWRTREWLDIFFGGKRPIRRSPPGPELQVGDFIDSWKVIRREPNQFLSLLFGMKGPGLGRLEVTIRDLGDERELNVTAWWHPKGFLGLLYWFAMMPAHLFIFFGMVRAIVKKASKEN